MNRLIVISVTIFLQVFSLAQKTDVRLVNVTSDHNTVIQGVDDIFQDSYGFIWLGTNTGLYRYDGVEFKRYSADLADSTSLPHNNVNCIFEDSRNRLWVGTRKGLGIFDFERDNFTNFYSDDNLCGTLSNDLVNALFEDSQGNIWVGAWNGLNKVQNPEVDELHQIKFKYYPYYQDGSVPEFSSWIVKIIEDKEGNIWTGNRFGGIHQFDTKQQKFIQHHFKQGDGPEFLQDNGVMDIYIDKQNQFWIATWTGGLHLFDQEKRTFKKYLPDDSNPYSIHNNQVKSIEEGKDGTFWLGTEDGISIMNREEERFFSYTYTEGEKNGLGAKIVNDLFEDNEGRIWVADYEGELYFYNPLTKHFKNYQRVGIKDKNKGIVRSLTLDVHGNVLVGNFEGIDIFNTEDNTIRPLNISQTNRNKSNSAALGFKINYIDESNRIWFNTGGGQVYSIEENRYVDVNSIYPYQGKDRMNYFYRFTDKEGNVWLSTENKITRYNKVEDRYIHYSFADSLKKKYVLSFRNANAMHQDKNGDFWISVSEGFCKVGADELKENDTLIKVFYSIDAFIQDIEEDKVGNIWLATNKGIWKFDKNKNDFEVFTTKEGLSNNLIHAIEKDNHGCFWLMTGYGLSRFDVENKVFRNFYTEHGLSSNRFIDEAVCSDHNGRIYVGGKNGFSVFHPDSFLLEVHESPIYFTGFKLFNEPVVVASNSVLNKPMFLTNELRLKHNQDQVTIKFASLDYSNARRVKYQYKIDEEKNNWIDLPGNEVFFTQLSPGEYNLLVRASNQNGEWSQKNAKLKLIVYPPFWKTLWFRVLLAVFFAILIFVIYQVRIKNYKRRQEDLEKQVRERTVEILLQKEEIEAQANHLSETNAILLEKQEEISAQADEIFETNIELQRLNATKDKFFGIIAHDLKNPFQSISGFSDIIVNKFSELKPEKILEMAEMIQGSSKMAAGLLENLLEWARSQTGDIVFKAEVFDVNKVAEEIIKLLAVNASEKQIKLENKISSETYIFADKNMIQTVLRNLINNAIKFTPPKGVVTLMTEKKKGFILLIVKDNGVGMEAKTIEKLFRIDQSYSTKGTSGEPGSGLGLIICKDFVKANRGVLSVKSKLREGTQFIIELPENENAVLSLSKEEQVAREKKKESNKVVPEIITVEREKKFQVLIIEDTLEIRTNLKANLDEHYNVIEAVNGKEGVGYALKIIPDLIISDVMMPEMDGFEVCEKLKNEEATSHIPIILLTAKAMKADKLAGLGTGADDYITKPFDADLLLARTENLIQTRIKLREKFRKGLLTVPSEVTLTTIDEKFLAKMLNYVHENMENNALSGNDLMKEAGMGKTTFFKKLKAVTGQTPSEFIRALRIKKAAQYLKYDKNLTVNEVAYMVGFNDRTYFHKCFVAEFGMAPGEYRK